MLSAFTLAGPTDRLERMKGTVIFNPVSKTNVVLDRRRAKIEIKKKIEKTEIVGAQKKKSSLKGREQSVGERDVGGET